MWILFVTGISERKFSKIFTENFSLLFALNTVACVTNFLDAFLINLFSIALNAVLSFSINEARSTSCLFRTKLYAQ